MAKKVTNLKINEKKVKRGNLELKIGAGAGALVGAQVAGYINSAFPNIVQVAGTAIVSGLPIANASKIAAYTALASAPIDWIAPVIITGIGAGLGALAGKGIKVIKDKLPKKADNKLAAGRSR